MPRKSAPAQSASSAKSTSVSAPSTSTSTPSTPSKKTKKPSSARGKSKSAVATTTPVAEPVAVVEATPVATVDNVSVLQDEFAEFLGKLNQVSSQFSALRTDFRTLEKKWTRELKTAQKTMEKRRRKVGNRAPSGFVKPTLISNELSSFLGKPSGTEMARTEVTREINKYIRANALQDKTNGRKINPDAALKSLLNIGANDELTYFNLQRYMSPHFAKLGQEVPAANSK